MPAENLVVQHRRGTNAQLGAMIPADGELLWDQTLKVWRGGDGIRRGGFKSDYGINVQNMGAKGDWTGASADATDDTAAIQSAIDLAALTGAALRIPAGTYKCVPATVTDDENGTNQITVAFVMKSNLRIVADPGAVFKLADEVSTDAAAKNVAMFFSNVALENISFEGLTIDMNAGANTISPLRGIGTYNRFTFSHILFSGKLGETATVARCTNMRILACNFLNTPGVTCIGMGQSESVGALLGSNWEIGFCLFDNNGTDTDDHSSIYGLADDVFIHHCLFTADNMADTTGPGVAHEVHGANQDFSHNIVRNYRQGLWIAANKSSDCDNITISHNVISPVRNFGMRFYRETAAESVISKVKITDNFIGIPDYESSDTFKAALTINSTYYVKNVTFARNTFQKVGTNYRASLVLVSHQGTAVPDPHTNITIEDNEAIGASNGVFMTTNANGIGSITIRRNRWKDFVPAGTAPNDQADTRGVYLERLSGVSHVGRLIIEGNQCVDGSMDYGVRLQSGTIDYLYHGPGACSMNVTSAYTETNAVTVTNRSGHYPIRTYTPVINIGGVVAVGNGTLNASWTYQGGLVTAWAQYTIGSTDVIPGGNLNIGLPVASLDAGRQYLGVWRIVDTSTGDNYQGICVNDGTGQYAALRDDGGTTASSGGPPVALAAGDVIEVQITYKAGIC